MSVSTDSLIFPCGMSRSGTTLLATILDSHSQVSMGYELIPPEMSGGVELLKYLEYGLELCNSDFSTCGRLLRDSGYPNEGLFFTRCYRAGVDEQDLKILLLQMQDRGLVKITTFRQRLEVAWMIAKKSSDKRSKSTYGFKLNIPSVQKAYNFFPKSRFLYIIRDPRDVVASHIQRKFDRTIPEICRAWNNYIESFDIFVKANQHSALIVRYESIVADPENILPKIFDFIDLPMEESVLKFYKSKAGVHTYGHPNSENLKKDFFTTSVGRWKSEIDMVEINQIENLCGQKMTEYKY